MRIALVFGLFAVLHGAAAPAESDGAPGSLRERWLKNPAVSVMTGFIYQPLKPYTIQKWMENLGSRFDADAWVRDFKEAGASHLVFYDKWIDGLVFHDTKTTGFKTRRDFLRELAAACQRGGLPLVLYFNAVSDGNPEFDQWALLDKQGKPIVFAPQWPTRYQTLHSPFHQKAVEQVREILSNYGPIHGLWHDIFSERLNTSSPWVAKGYEKMFGEPFEKASGEKFGEFNARTLAGYLDEIDAIRRRQGQTQCLFTSNGAGSMFLHGGVWTDLVGSRLQYLYDEGHSFAANDQLARKAWVLPKPLDICLLLSSSWFTPLEDASPPSHLTRKQAIAATAIAVCQGAGVNLALTPGHSGLFGEDLQRAKAIGAWFGQVKPYLEDAQPYADVAIVLGTPAAGGPGLPSADPFWKRYQGQPGGAWQRAVAMSDGLARRGVFSRLLYLSPQGGYWPEGLKQFRAILAPELAVLDQPRLDRLRQYVREGGRLIAFGHASLLDEKGQRRPDYGLSDVLGARFSGEVVFPAESQTATIRVDSEYNAAFGSSVLAGGPGEAWASNGDPMPHWVEITLPEAIEVARVELVNRAGPYQITDFDLEIHEQNQWRQIKSIRNARERILAVTLAPPLKAEELRVKILRELYQGQDRQYADVQAIRVLDVKGHEWVRGLAAKIPLVFSDPEEARAMGDKPCVWPPMAVRAQPTTARTVATLKSLSQDRAGQPQTSEVSKTSEVFETRSKVADAPAAILANRFGQGTAYLLTTSDGLSASEDSFWAGLARLAGGAPTIQLAPEDARRYRVLLTKIAGGHVLHVIDSQADAPNALPRPVSISLASARVGDPRQATLIGSPKPLELSRKPGHVLLVVQPDPVATVFLKHEVSAEE